ncbi:MAG: PD-(D/E)XK nuclease family protein [Clostridia bacterium]|nr:PD-(D/E)XK nuclease family protein [Clostridia bacterium]
MLKFLLGRSGSGKTKYILTEIEKRVKAGERTYLLVPEQQVYISECMLAYLPPSSALCFEVISFSRLCELVFSRLGGLAERSAGKGARNLLMWQTLRELSPTLSQYKGTKVDSSFTDIMLSLVDELHANGISAEECERISEKCEGGELGAKLSDVGVIYADFMRNIEERLGQAASDAENKLSRLASLLRHCDIFKDAAIFVDSFTSFTAEEHKVLEGLIECAESVTLSFTYERGSRAPHMESISDTVKRLTRFVREMGIEHEDIYLDRYTRTDKRELVLLEENLWNFSVTDKNRPEVDKSERGSIEMTVTANEYDEIWLAGLNILKERERGVKFSEMALIARDPESRKGMIDAIFEELGIPYFISERTDLSATAPARLILSALRCIAHSFNSSDVLTLYKTGLLGVDTRDGDLFEDYVRTWKINGKTFLEGAWSMNPDGYTTEISRRGQGILEAANRVRAAIIPPLANLKTQFAINKGNTLENCRALYSYLEQIKLSENLSAYAESALLTGDTRGAGEILRLYDYIVSTLTDIACVLGDTEMSAEDLALAIEIMLKNTDIGSVPAMSDYVTVGSGATLRVENIKTALLVGLCEGEFPANYSDSGILTENDKKKMEELGLSLTSREASITSDELFYVYRAMAKPEEKLYLSTSRQSISGRAQNPSSAWNRVAFLFPYIEPKYFDFGFVRGLCELSESEATEDTAEITEESADVRIDPFYVRMLFGNKLTLSQTKISSFAECPYKYWCENVLSLREQGESAISYNSAGTIVHYILEKLISSLNTEDGKLREIGDEELVSTVNELLQSYIGGINCPLPPSMMYSFSRLRDLALIMAKSVIEEFRSSRYRIVAYEKRISDKIPGALKPMEIVVDGIENPPTVTLGGIVDRIDLYEGEDKSYLRVVDYKTGIHRFDVDKISSGTDLQLPAYLFTATLEANKGFFAPDKELVPSSALFLSAEEGEGKIEAHRSGFLLSDEELLHAASPEMDPEILAGIKQKKDGTLSGKAALEYESLMEIDNVMRKTISDTARGMYSGRAPRTPSESACKFCKMKSTCPVAHKS